MKTRTRSNPRKPRTTKEVVRAIKAIIGRDRIFGCCFRKLNGELRTGSFRLGVTAGLTGRIDGTAGADAVDVGPSDSGSHGDGIVGYEETGPIAHPRPAAPYDPEERGIMIVYDMTKQDYRSIKLENVLSIAVHGHYIEKQPDGSWHCDGQPIMIDV